jgi:alpha-beta hydrolase superfamily lysophospholipase
MNNYFSVKLYSAKNERKILFFFPAAFTQMWHYRWTVFSLNKMGVTVVGLNIAWNRAIRELDFDGLLELVKQIDGVVSDTISKNSLKSDYAVLGVSIGSVLSLYAAKRHDSINSIILFVPFGTLSNLYWTHKPSRPFLDTLMKNGLRTEQDLEKLTQPIETQYQLHKIKHKKLVSFLGKRDKIVHDGQKLIEAIKEQDIDATFYESPFGHFGTALVGLLRKSQWNKILK